MGRIQSSVGLVTGINIKDTVDQLIAVQARSRDLVTGRKTTLLAQQTAVSDLTALVLGVQIAAKKFKSADAFTQKSVTSSNTNLLTATAGPSSVAGDYQFIPARRAQSHHLLSNGLASTDQPLGAGSLSLRHGGFVNTGIDLEELNGGAGVARGKIRITDRGGASALVDLRFAQTIEDVVAAINNNDDFEVDAATDGDRLVLTDRSGGAGNLKVAEVSGGKTAADLGLGGINVAADTATGQDILRLHNALGLQRLNDGNGVAINSALPDLQVTFRDGSSPLQIDFHRLASAAAKATATTSAANGLHAQVKFTAVQTGGDFDGVTIQFVDTGAATQGTETVVFDDVNNTLTFDIDAGLTTADNVIAALAGDPVASLAFTASRATGGNGSGVIALADTATTSGGAALAATNEKTLGELLQTINAADPARLQATISAGGDRLVFTDLTAGAGTFAVASTVGGRVAEDLALTGAAAGGTITSGRLLAGLKTSLLRSTNGGSGPGTLGLVQLTDRSGATASVNLAGAETLDEVISAINNSGLGIKAGYNTARNGIALVDTTGAAASNLIAANGDATNTATKLKLNASVADTKINSGSLNRQVVSRSTLLSSYNGGRGIATGSFIVTDSEGNSGTVNLKALGAETVGDVLDAINNLALGIEARLNDAGDGIAVVNTAAGGETLNIKESGGGRAAADLRILGSATSITAGGQPAQGINGTTTITIKIDADDTLADLVTKINASDAGVGASVFSNGSGSLPHQLSLLSEVSGRSGSLIVDGTLAGLSFEEIAAGQDALVQLGFSNSSSGGRLISSATNKFTGISTGLDVTIAGTSTDSVTVTVAKSAQSLNTSVQAFVDQVNKLRDKLKTYTAFNAEAGTKGTLFGSSETLRIDADLSRLLTSRLSGAGSVQTLAELGVSIDGEGKLSFDQSKLTAKHAADPEGLKKFFADENSGFAKRVNDLIETFAGVDNSVLVNRNVALQRQIETSDERIAFMTARLERSRETLLNQFFNMELVISKLKDNASALSSIQYIAPVQRAAT